MSLAYGVWHLADGSEVLFSRRYCPLWKRHPDGHVEQMEYERVPWIRQTYLHFGGVVTKSMGKLLEKTETDFTNGWPVKALVARIDLIYPGVRPVVRATKREQEEANIKSANVVRLFPKDRL